MNRLPRRILLGHYRIDIALVNQDFLREEMGDEDDGYYEGCWIPGLDHERVSGRIYILQTLPISQKWEVLWHELFHALTDISGWDRETRPIR